MINKYEFNNDKVKIGKGLVRTNNGKAKCLVYAHEVATICPEPMELDEVVSAHRAHPATNSPGELDVVKTEIPDLVRTSHMNGEEKIKIVNLLKEYPEIIKREKDKLTSTKLIKHKITTRDENPVYTRNYRHPVAFRTVINNEIHKLLENKIIQNSNSPYNSSIWVAPKKPDASGKRKIRLVIDYRKLNEKTVEDEYPLPNIEDLFGKIGRATYFSAIDSLWVSPDRNGPRIHAQNSI